MKNKNARCVIWLDLSLHILIISLQILVGLFGGRKEGIGDEPEFHLVVGEVSLSHLVGWYQTLSPTGSRHLQQGRWLTTHAMQERGRGEGE